MPVNIRNHMVVSPKKYPTDFHLSIALLFPSSITAS
jgi:hypothetical protein